jgi:hypothetical protein
VEAIFPSSASKLVCGRERGTNLQSTAMRVGLQIFCSGLVITAALPFLAATRGVKQAARPAETAPAQATAITRDALAGEYDGGQMEVGARLLLQRDGHFKYELAYGAMDESADGTWELKDGAVFLTTVPVVKPPRFVVESDTPEPRGGLWIKISSGPVMEGSRQRIYLVYGPDEEQGMVEIGDDGSVPFPGNRRPTAIVPEIPVYPVTNKPIPLTGTGGHRLVLRFEPNDIGKADFRGQRLGVENGVLVMPRRDLGLMLRFKRQQGGQ